MNSFAKLIKAMFKGWTLNKMKKIHCKRSAQSKINQVLKSPKSFHKMNPKWMSFIVNLSKSPLTKEDYLSLEWWKGFVQKPKKQTNKRKKQRKWNDPRNGHQIEVRQEMSCVNKTNKASEVKQEMLCDNKTNKANEVSA